MAQPNYFTCTLGQAASLDLVDPDFRNINQFIDTQAEECGGNPAVGFAIPPSKVAPDRPWGHTVYTFKDVLRASLATAALLQKRHGSILETSQTVALICPSTPEFLFTWLGLMRLGHAVLLIAPQCQPAAIAHLCKACDTTLLYYDPVYESQAVEAAKVASADAPLEAKALPFKSEFEIMQLMKIGTGRYLEPANVSPNDTAYLHHTSGTSSGVPKPIPQSHRAGAGVLPHFSGGREKATFTTTPLYHGGIADLFRAWKSGALIWLFPGKGVPITANNIVKCLDVAAECRRQQQLPPVRYFSSVPYILQSLEANENGLRYLQMMDIVGVGGAALPAEVGDRLVSNGVNLISRFGSAECGFIMSSYRDYDSDKEWQYLRSGVGKERLQFEAQEDPELAELVVANGWPHMAKKNREDGAFATADLFARHPTINDAWRYHSRADSQLTLITGKKFDPAPLEGAIAASDLLDDVIIFGNGQPFPGALLFRSENSRSISDSALIEKMWPVVDKLNGESQDHARIPKKMLIAMAVLDTPLEKSSKGTLIRGAAEKRFGSTIDDAYVHMGSIDDNDDGETYVPDDKVLSAIKDMVRGVTSGKGALEDDADLFAYGVDSVAGMQIRYGLRKLLARNDNDNDSGGQGKQQLPLNIVEDCGTVQRLSDWIVRARHHHKNDANTGGRNYNDEGGDDDQNEAELKLMLDLADRYSKFVARNPKAQVHNGSLDHDDKKDVLVLTGATGALGAHALYQYLQNESVTKIYCLVRGADEHAAKERVRKSLEQRGLVVDLGTRVTVLPASLGDARLGLSGSLYEQIADEATMILHLAWSVNFRMRLRSFEKDNIAGVTNLVNLALSSSRSQCPRLGFCSSVASVMAMKPTKTATALPTSDGASPTIIPEAIVGDPSAATTLGYSRSKWVAEQVCHRAAEHTALRGRISVFRVGQLSGDSHRGVWNTKEAWPMMLSLVKTTDTLPDLEGETLDWLPVDIAATALLQCMTSVVGDKGPIADDGKVGRPQQVIRECSQGVVQESTNGSRSDAKTQAADGSGSLTDVVHVVNDRTNPKWRQMLQWLQKQRSFRIVSPSEWIDQLEALAEQDKRQDGNAHPALGLLELWKNAYGRDSSNAVESPLDEEMDTENKSEQEENEYSDQKVVFAMNRTRAKIPVLREIQPLDEEYFGKIWRWIDATM